MTRPNEKTIRTLVRTAVESFAQGFQARHEAEVDDPDGTINMKIHSSNKCRGLPNEEAGQFYCQVVGEL